MDSGQQAINMEKLERMEAYAEARVCRRRILLSYFSEERDCDCGNCDVCLEPPPRFDGTILAQKALSAVARTGWTNIGIMTLINILRGSLRADIRRNGYDSIKTFGAGADLGYNEWSDYISQMVQLGVFEIAYDDSNHLRVTPFGQRILRGEAHVTLSAYVEADRNRKSGAAKAKKEIRQSDPTTELFEQLKAVRADVARRDGVPPYIVFSDATLMDMAVRMPADLDAMLAVNGVGEKKAVRYGRGFIAAIRKFAGLASGRQQGSSLRETLVLFNAGESVAEIASDKGVKSSTIYSHIAELIDNDMISDYGRVIDREAYRDIMETLRSNPDGAYEVLKERYPAGLVGVARAVARALERRTL